MNYLYHWHDDRMTELEMHQVRQEMEHLRMLKEAPASLAMAGF